MTYPEAIDLKESLLKDYIFLEREPRRRYFFNIPSDSYSFNSLKDDIYDFINGIGIIKNEDSEFGIKIYTEGRVPKDALVNYLKIHSNQLIVDNIGPITVLGNVFKMGDSISNINGAPGTLGCFVKDANNDKHILSNYHVLTNFGKGSSNTQIISPAVKHGGDKDLDISGHLSYYKPVKFSRSKNYVDCATAKLVNQNVFQNTMPDGLTLTGSDSHTDGMQVVKYGQKTGFTTGFVSSINSSVKVDYGEGFFGKKIAHFYDQFEIVGAKGVSRFSDMGDSGSLVIDNQSNKAVGLIFAGSSNGTAFANPIKSVLDALSVEII